MRSASDGVIRAAVWAGQKANAIPSKMATMGGSVRLGADHVIHGRIPGHEEQMVVRVPDVSIVNSDRISLYPNREKIMFFDASTEKRIV